MILIAIPYYCSSSYVVVADDETVWIDELDEVDKDRVWVVVVRFDDVDDVDGVGVGFHAQDKDAHCVVDVHGFHDWSP
jgi:hypothetical protein